MVRPVCHGRGGVGGQQATDAANSGPGAGVSPYEWMDSCAGCFLRKNLAFVFRVLHSGHMLMHMYRTAGAETGNFAISPCLFQESTNPLLHSLTVDGALLFNRPGRGSLTQALPFACSCNDTCISS